MIDIFSKARNKQLSEKKILAIRGPGYQLNNPGDQHHAAKVSYFWLRVLIITPGNMSELRFKQLSVMYNICVCKRYPDVAYRRKK